MSSPGLPSDVNKVTVTGQFVNLRGEALIGSIVFTPNLSWTIDSAHHEIIAGAPISAALDVTGSFSLQLPCTDDTDLNPTIGSYAVRDPAGRTFNMVVPLATPGNTLNLSSVVVTNTPTPGIVQIISSPLTMLNRLVQSGGTYPTRPTTGYVDFLGDLDPGVLLLNGDTWTQVSPSGPPNAPTIGSATAGDTVAVVSFTPATAGAAATTYTATSTPGSVTAVGAGSPLTVTGLTNGTAYTFVVHASNTAGNSAESAASNSVTPLSTALVDTFTGSNGAAWSSVVWKTAPAVITMDIQSNQGRAAFTSTGTFEEFTRRFQPANSTDWDVRVQIVAPPSTTGWQMSVWFQAVDWPNGSNTPTTAYQLDIQAGGYFIVSRLTNTASALVGFTGFNFTAGGWCRIKVVGGVMGYKIWTGLVTDEPGSFTPVANTAPLVGTGEAGVVFSAGATAGLMDFRIDNVAVTNTPT